MTGERLCWACLKGTIIELEVGAVCTFCRRKFSPTEVAPLPSLEDLLAFAEAYPRANGGQVRRAFGISQLRYVAALNRALDDPEAMTIAPRVVSELRERRERMEAARNLASLPREAESA